jgi:Mn-containing catalase
MARRWGVLRSLLARSSSPAWSERRLIGDILAREHDVCPSDQGEVLQRTLSYLEEVPHVLPRSDCVILRIDRLQTELPPPSDPDPIGASAVQELLGGKYGEMSTFMNYTYQSFNFRNRQGARPFYDLVASIAAEEFGHIELVSAAINTMLTGAAEGEAGELGDLTAVKGVRNTQHFIAGGAGALVQDSNAKPWNGDYVFASGDLIEDLTHNFFLETGARNNKLKVYEMVDHPAARALTGYLLVRGGVHQVAYARALENLTGADLMKLFPSPRIPTDKIPECQPHIKRGEHLKLYRFSPSDFQEIKAVFNGPHPETGEDLMVAEEASPEGVPAFDLPPQEAVFAPGPDPEMLAEVSAKLRKAAGLPAKPTGVVANDGDGNGVVDKVKDAVK